MERKTNLMSDTFNVTCAKCGSGNIKEITKSICYGETVYWECMDCGARELMFEFCE